MWTKRSYDVLYDWLDVNKRDNCRKIMRADGLDDVVDRLDRADTLGDWYKITHEAAASVGPKVVEQSANQAEIELDQAAAALGRKGGSSKSAAKQAAVRENGKKGGRPKKHKI